jgi:ABC-type glycerol-3-phosphate transport system substrate-binding protein
MNRLGRRTILGGALGALARTAVNAQGGKPYAGTTLNCACFQTTYFDYLRTYFPQFEEKTGIKVNFNMQAFPVYNQRTDLELSTKGSAIDVCNVTFIYSGRWIGAAGSPTSTPSPRTGSTRRPNGRRRTSSAARNRRCRTPRARPSAMPGWPAR